MSEASEIMAELHRLRDRRDGLEENRRVTLDRIYRLIREGAEQGLSIVDLCEAAGVDRAGAYRAWERMGDTG